MSRALVAGTDQVQLPADSTGKRAGFVKSAIGAAGSEIYLPVSCLTDDAGNTIDGANSRLLGTERGLVVRAILDQDDADAATATTTLDVTSLSNVTAAIDLQGRSAVVAQIGAGSGNLFAGNARIGAQVSTNGSDWTSVFVRSVSAPAGGSSTPEQTPDTSAGVTGLFLISGVSGARWLRFNTARAGTGTQTISVSMARANGSVIAHQGYGTSTGAWTVNPSPTSSGSFSSLSMSFANTTTSITAAGYSDLATGGLNIAGTWTGTVVLEAQYAGSSSWVTVPLRNVATGALQTSITANGDFLFDLVGLASVTFSLRLRVSVAGTGTVTGNWAPTRAVSALLIASMIAQQTLTADVSDRATREVGRTRLWDGTDEATVIARDASPAPTDKGLAVVPLVKHEPGYQVVTTEITSATTTGIKELLTLWHPNTLLKDAFILEIGINFRIVQTAGTFGFELQFISAENATPGGTTLTPQPFNRGDAASGLTVRQVVTGAPTVTGSIFQRATFPLPAAASPMVTFDGFIVFSCEDRVNYSDAIQLRNGQSEGLRISQDIAAALTTAPIFTAYAKYVERS